MENLKKFKGIIILVVVALVVVLFWFIASSLIEFGNNHGVNDARKEKLAKEEEEFFSKVGSESNTKVYIEGTEKDGYAKVSLLFSGEDLDNRQKNFLGENYQRFEPMLLEVENNYENVFSDIPSIDSEEPNLDSCLELDNSDIDLFNEQVLEEGNCLLSENMMTIIGMYGTHCVVYKYQYGYSEDNNLLVVDYTDALFNKQLDYLYGFGQVKSVLIDPKYSKLVDKGDYRILYVKGY